MSQQQQQVRPDPMDQDISDLGRVLLQQLLIQVQWDDATLKAARLVDEAFHATTEA